MKQNYVMGLVTGTVITTVVFLFPMIFGPSEKMYNKNLQFKVVGQYNGNNVVRFQPLDSTAGFQYFLDCNSIN